MSWVRFLSVGGGLILFFILGLKTIAIIVSYEINCATQNKEEKDPNNHKIWMFSKHEYQLLIKIINANDDIGTKNENIQIT